MDFIEHAIQETYSSFGERVSVINKYKSVNKFGRNDAVGTSFETVWSQGGTEPYASTNAITTISSSSGSDAGQLVLEGHTVVGTGADAKFTFTIQTVQLNGQNQVTLATPLARASRLYNITAVPLVGDVYVYEDDTDTNGVPDTTSGIHLKILATEAQTYKCATTFSDLDYGFMTNIIASVNKKTAASVDFEVQVRRVGQLFRPIFRFGLASAAQPSIVIPLSPYVIVPSNSDVRIQAAASSSNTSVEAAFQTVLAKVV